ncbi:MAG: hypothetical protein HYU51_00005 [Candidatus Rokubacteria bacterium]|nr:hypothetical protein [Candidatus Rokubacteria bacterium]
MQCLWAFVTERRCREILDTLRAGAARFPHAVKALWPPRWRQHEFLVEGVEPAVPGNLPAFERAERARVDHEPHLDAA